MPSAVSAIKVDGQRAYARVRAGEDVELAARPVTVSRFDVHDVRPARTDDGSPVLDVDVTVVVSSGTYVRALARDLGAGLGVGGHLTALRRTRVGGYGLDVARSLDDLGALPMDEPIDVVSLADSARATFPVRDLTRRRGPGAVLRAVDRRASRMRRRRRWRGSTRTAGSSRCSRSGAARSARPWCSRPPEHGAASTSSGRIVSRLFRYVRFGGYSARSVTAPHRVVGALLSRETPWFLVAPGAQAPP